MKSLFWHRRDLRIEDNAGLFKALKSSNEVVPIFIFDKNILNELNKDDQRVLFLYNEIKRLKEEYLSHGSDLHVFFGDPLILLPSLAKKFSVQSVFANRDYEPYAIHRDKSIHDLLKNNSVGFIGSKDHVIFEKDEIVKNDLKPYTVYTPYSKKWKEKLTDYYLKPYDVSIYSSNLTNEKHVEGLISLDSLGFNEKLNLKFPDKKVVKSILRNYHETRDIPFVIGTSRLSVHLRFGTISIRQLAKIALKENEKFLNELIWRDFYQTIIYFFPDTVCNSFKPKYDNIPWINDIQHFEKWKLGETGYPIVDAGMRELNQTGFMHNRVRMVTASFLVKHLLIDWRWGEAYFAEKLLDFDLASNVGGWQWAASSGCDAAPYFRVFNPELQQQRFDSDFKYIKMWVPEFNTTSYPKPIVDHKFARERVISVYKKALQNE